MAIRSVKYALALFALIQTVRTAPKPFDIDFHGSVGTSHINKCTVGGSCNFGVGSRPGGVTTSNTHVTGPATFDTDFNSNVGTSHISKCQQDGSCRFQGKRSAPDDIIIPLLKKVTQKRQPRDFDIDFQGSVGTSHINKCAVSGSCNFGGRSGSVTTSNTHVTGPATFDTDFNGHVATSHISSCQQNGSCRFQGKRSVPDNSFINPALD